MKLKKRVLFYFLISVFISSITSSCSDDDPVTSGGDLKSEELQRIVDSLTNYYHTERSITSGGFLVRINTNSGSYFASSGITPSSQLNSHFRIASITKTFNAASIMLLHQEGKVNIDDYISGNFPGTTTPYLPATPDYDVPYKDEITIKQLLEHRAGVFDVINDPIPASVPEPYAGQLYVNYILETPGMEHHTFTFDELVGLVSRYQLSISPPGLMYHYSNTGYNILGKIIERASGMTWSEFNKVNFFLPLNLINTSSVWSGDDDNIPSPLIESFMYDNGIKTNTTLQNMSPHVSEGNLISTPEDITRWMTLLLTGQAGINMSNVERMKEVIPTGQGNAKYGLGLSYIDGLGYGHNGAHVSFLTADYYNPDTGITILLISNFWDYDEIIAQGNGMAEFALNAVRIFR